MKKLLTALLTISYFFTNAQQSINASGGNASGSNGSVSYSVGQVFYESALGSNGSILQGVQHPFEIFILGTDAFSNSILQASVYPNPTTAYANLKITNYPMEYLEFHLYDILGKLIISEKILHEETSISMMSLPTGTYLLQVAENNKTLKTFKIIKNQ